MKTKFWVSLMTVLAVLTLLQNVLATTGKLNVNIDYAKIKGVSVEPGANVNIAGFGGEVVPVEVVFSSNVNVSDAKVKAWIGGYREEIAKSTRRLHLIDGSIYSEVLSLKLPSDIDPEESYTLYIRIETKTDYKEEEFNLKLQRESYTVEILDVDTEKTVNAGSSLAVDIVVKNRGYETLEDVFVVVSIPELDIKKKAYFEDLTSEDTIDNERRDSGERRIYLKIPSSVQSGIYELKVEAYNPDSSDVETKRIAIVGEEESKVVVPITSRAVSIGEIVSYDLVIVNSGARANVYEVIPETSEGVIVSVSEPVVTVPADSSKSVEIKVKGVKEGTYTFTVNINSEGKLVKRVNLTAVVTEKLVRGNIVIFAVILAIIFIVLLIVLIVLLTRKPTVSEELEESYY